MKAIELLRAMAGASEHTVCRMADFSTEDATSRQDHMISLFGTDRTVAGKPYKHLYLYTNRPLKLLRQEIKADIIVKEPDGKYVYMYKIEE